MVDLFALPVAVAVALPVVLPVQRPERTTIGFGPRRRSTGSRLLGTTCTGTDNVVEDRNRRFAVLRVQMTRAVVVLVVAFVLVARRRWALAGAVFGPTTVRVRSFVILVWWLLLLVVVAPPCTQQLPGSGSLFAIGSAVVSCSSAMDGDCNTLRNKLCHNFTNIARLFRDT